MRHNDITLFELVAAVDIFNGPAGLRAVLAGREFDPVKHGEMTLGQIEAGRNKIPDNVWVALLRDEVEFVLDDPTKVQLRPKEQLLVDTDGRFIFRNIPQVEPPNWAYGFDRSIQLAYPDLLERSEFAFQRKIGISAGQFEDKAEHKKAAITSNPLLANLFLGRSARPFAIALPQMQVPQEDRLGRLLTETIIPAATRGYLRQYPGRSFVNCLGNDILIRQVECSSGSRQDQLLAALARGPQVLWVFLNCLQGASINAARALIQILPEEFILGGTLVNAPVIAAYPEIAAARSENPLYFCAADVFRRSDSLYLDPNDDDVSFDRWDGLGGCNGGVALPF